jgi:RimJ/RimL family protein N-acetyltransferase
VELDVRRAGPADLELVRSVLEEASAWLHARGIEQWPAQWPDQWIVPAIDAGTTWLAHHGDEIVGTITLQWDDPVFWGAQPPVAGYVHRLAVRRAAAGAGAALLTWAERAVVTEGRELLRLDTWSGNTSLRAYYEAAGFVHVGDTVEETWTVSRYEKRLSDPES